MATKAERIATIEDELAEVRNALRGIRRSGATGASRAGRNVSFMSPEMLERSENRLVLALNRLRGVPEEWEFKRGEAAATGTTPGTTTGETDLTPSEPDTMPVTRYLAVKATSDFDADDYLGGVEFTGDQVTVPTFPEGVHQAHIGVAIEAGKVITRIAFDPDSSNQNVTDFWSQENEIVIAGQSYTPWDSNGVYFSNVAGFDLKVDIEDE